MLFSTLVVETGLKPRSASAYNKRSLFKVFPLRSNPRPSSWTVYVGGANQASMSTEAQSSTVTNVITHEAFDDDTYENDIALLRLNRQVAYDPETQPICLPPADYQLKANAT